MEKRVLLGQFSDQAQAQATLTALTDLGRAMRRPVRAEIVTAYQVIAKVNSPLRAQRDLKLTDKSAVRCQHCDIVIGLSLGLNIGDVFYVGTPAYIYVSRPGDIALVVLFGVMIAGFTRSFLRDRAMIAKIQQDREFFEGVERRFNAQFQAAMGPYFRKTFGRDYMLTDRADAIACLYCGSISHHPEDVQQRYCGRCHRFLGITGPPA